jgi:hypothetical protein
MFKKPENWGELNPDQKISCRLDYWGDPARINFANPVCREQYLQRIKILRDAITLQNNPRVPAIPVVGNYVTRRAGFNGYDALYNHETLLVPIMDFHREFQPDVFVTSGPMPGKVWEILDYQAYAWAGHGLPHDQQFQTIDGEYMTADDYPALIRDPSGFWMKHYLPRVFGALAPMRKMVALPTLTEIGAMGAGALPFGLPDVQEMMHKLMEAGNAAMKCFMAAQQISMQVDAAGFPTVLGPPFCTVPFDMIGDMLRGTRGIMTDLYKRPDDVLTACERLLPIVVNELVESCNRMGRAFVTIPLHKGADGFMSDRHFRKFYWPTLRGLMEGLNAEGIMPLLFAEGGYNSRLEAIADYPEARAIWYFDQTDMRQVEAHLGGRQCVQGNVPSSLMTVSSTDKLRAYCEDLLEVFAGTGGFILANGAVLENTTDDHVRTLIEVVRQ